LVSDVARSFCVQPLFSLTASIARQRKHHFVSKRQLDPSKMCLFRNYRGIGTGRTYMRIPSWCQSGRYVRGRTAGAHPAAMAVADRNWPRMDQGR
jgi:hypothetical protein